MKPQPGEYSENMQWEFMARARLIEDTHYESFRNKGHRGESVIGISQHIQVQTAGEPSCNQSSVR